MMDVFNRYAPFIQDFIYKNHWQSLRAIQVAAGDAIFNTDGNLLLCASTASGKTEAAFFPILTLLSENPSASVGVLYIGPLKALINDQFARLNDLCMEEGIPVWHWHGDVSQSHKNKMIRHPSGILQITPESLEALLLHKHSVIGKLFCDLRFVVIDEVHSLMRGDRGGQTLCLLERLNRLAGCSPRRVGLSATIGDLEATGRFLAAGTGKGTVIPRIHESRQIWRLSMEHFYVKDAQAGEDRTDMPESLDHVIRQGTWGLKLHMLNVMKGTRLASEYPGYQPFPSIEEYVDLVCDLVERTPPEVTIHRLTADCPRPLLIAPPWSYEKRTILNGINAELVRRGTCQGCRFGFPTTYSCSSTK